MSNKPLTAKEIRESFKQFFQSKGHQIVPSAPMVIKDDPTLMFTNAGMNQFKDIILGNKSPKWTRVTDSQKCLRVSGKHNDLEEVGHDTYHHTMFEMLGNWSFGDYFKKEAIDWAWEFLVDVLGLNPERLYATVFEGSAAEGLSRDDEAAAYWECHLPASHIINGNKHDNFWEMGDTGPCGPCSEIHIDLRSDEERAAVPGAEMVNKDHPQVIEIWNLVFMQFNRKADQSLEPLPAKVIDTGMGFERLCMALQGKTSNYDTDVFTPMIDKIALLSGHKYGEDVKVDVAMRVIADHPHHSFLHCRFAAPRKCQGRLCDSPHPAPCSALCIYVPGSEGGVPLPPYRYTDRVDGRGISRIGAPARADNEGYQRGGGFIPAHS